MLRFLRLAAVVIVAVVAADLFFRASLLRLVRPVIVQPADGAMVAAPVIVRWEGPQRMRLTLRYAGREQWDLGVRESPFELPSEHLRERGLYSIEVRALTFGDWISASRSFATEEPGEPSLTQQQQHDDVSSKLAALEESLQEMRDVQEDSHEENTNLYEENAAIREENAILTEELQQMAESEQRASGQLAAVGRDYGRLSDEHRLALEEVLQLRARLSSIVPCSVWGYFSHQQPQLFPDTRRVVVVSYGNGEILRSQTACEQVRRPDPAAVSPCFCVGSSFGD